MATKSQKQQEMDAAAKELREILKPGDNVHCVLVSKSRSGMSRKVKLLIPTRECRFSYSGAGSKPAKKYRLAIHNISYEAGRAMGYKYDPCTGSIKVDGGGMDMGFHLVYNLGATLWPKGTSKPHGTRNGEPDRDGGYALKSRWL